jgi:hypothetical protein
VTFRLTYLCELLFGGKFGDLAKDAGLSEAQQRSLVARGAIMHPNALGRLVSAGVVNAEWLLCGTGPMRPYDSHIGVARRLELPTTLAGSFPTFSSTDVPVELPQALKPKVLGNDLPPLPDFVPIARVIHAARVANKPVILALGAEAIYDAVGSVVASMLRKGYVTGLAFTGEAAAADLEVALFGSRASDTGLLHELSEMHTAARLAAAQGLGYGEALGRWAYPRNSHRSGSALSVACELNKPATVHVALGEAAAHFLPAKHGAEIGAAIGAASYADMMVFTQQLLHFNGSPGGVFLDADNSGQCARMFSHAMTVVQRVSKEPIDNYSTRTISGEYRRTFPALLQACDAVYDGTAADGK